MPTCTNLPRHLALRVLSACIAGLLLTQASAAEDERESPWLATPTLSDNPKLGTNIGAIVGYVRRFDPESEPSLIAAFGSYSNTDSRVGGVFADLRWDGNRHKATAGIFGGKIRNEYDDYLGTGRPAKTEDNVSGLAFRYSRQIVEHWYLGAQAIYTDYAINADGLLGDFLEQIGLTGFKSAGIGIVGEFDNRDNTRNPQTGNHLLVHNFAYREGLGGEESFDVYRAEYAHFASLPAQTVLGIQLKGRWTDDAPLSGYSSVDLRGYTMGNYLDKNYTHLDLDARIPLTGKWGLTGFAGVGCLYTSLSDCNSSDQVYPSVGAGVSYLLKPEAGIVIRAEYAVGEGDNRAFYLRMGHPF
ncbi:MAG: hypothetical protein P8080_12845 [Gammaproteobacteria bacterium]